MANATQIKFDSKTTAAPRTFGKGLHRSLPTFRTAATAADERAYLEMVAEDRAFDAIVDRLADEAAALDRLERGLDA